MTYKPRHALEDWLDALVVRQQGLLWARRGYTWVGIGHTGAVSPLPALEGWLTGPVTVVIDAEGRNVEAHTEFQHTKLLANQRDEYEAKLRAAEERAEHAEGWWRYYKADRDLLAENARALKERAEKAEAELEHTRDALEYYKTSNAPTAEALESLADWAHAWKKTQLTSTYTYREAFGDVAREAERRAKELLGENDE